MKVLILQNRKDHETVPGILWIHGGGYTLGMAEMVFLSCGKMLAGEFGGVVVAPTYRLAPGNPYPAALEDCYEALEYMWDNAEKLGIDRERIIVGGESAGGGLAAAVCLYARDKGRIKVALQLPLYPMLDCQDTDSSRDNHGMVWNTRRNHRGWKKYLGTLYDSGLVPIYASAARAESYKNMPPCYTFVAEGEPFYSETLTYVDRLKKDGVMAEVHVYPGIIHSFDLLCPWLSRSKKARRELCEFYETFMNEYRR